MKKLELENVSVGSRIREKICLLETYDLEKKKDNNYYVRCVISDGKESINAVIWDEAIVNLLKDNNLRNTIIILAADCGEYLDVKQLTVKGIVQYTGDEFTLGDFLSRTLDTEVLFEEFETILKEGLSENGYKLYELIFTPDVISRFKEEFAGIKYHDAQVSGLLNHTLKMLRLGNVILLNEPRLEEYIPNAKDLLLLGIAAHDIGKIKEYYYGSYSKNGYLTHRVFGMEMLYEIKSEIIQLFDEDFYYQLIAVIQGHHDEHGDTAKTIISYITYLIDMLDSQLTGLLDAVDRDDVFRTDHITVNIRGKEKRILY